MDTTQRLSPRRDPEKDVVKDSPKAAAKWVDVGNVMMPYEHTRPLTNETAQKANDYINACVKGFPFQLRYVMALPLWKRFCDRWCETGDEQESLRAI